MQRRKKHTDVATSVKFNYFDAFSRTLGLVSVEEQRRIAGARVAIAGLGGTGGAHAIAMARMGVGRYHLADFDRFEVANFNRQLGSAMSTCGRTKTRVTRAQVLDINPQAQVQLFRRGITRRNVDRFVAGMDVIIDALDFFAPKARLMLYQAARRHQVPVVCAAPVGLGTTVLVFGGSPKSMSFAQWTGMHVEQDACELSARFMVALLPRVLHLSSVVEPLRLDLAAHRAPSHVAGIMAAVAASTTEVHKLLVHRGRVHEVPTVLQVDLFSGRSRRTRTTALTRATWWRIKRAVVLRELQRSWNIGMTLARVTTDQSPVLLQIIDRARYTQSFNDRHPWRVTMLDHARRIVCVRVSVEAGSPRRGMTELLEAGMFLESLRAIARAHSLRTFYLLKPRYLDSDAIEVRVEFAADTPPATGFEVPPPDAMAYGGTPQLAEYVERVVDYRNIDLSPTSMMMSTRVTREWLGVAERHFGVRIEVGDEQNLAARSIGVVSAPAQLVAVGYLTGDDELRADNRTLLAGICLQRLVLVGRMHCIGVEIVWKPLRRMWQHAERHANMDAMEREVQFYTGALQHIAGGWTDAVFTIRAGVDKPRRRRELPPRFTDPNLLLETMLEAVNEVF